MSKILTSTVCAAMFALAAPALAGQAPAGAGAVNPPTTAAPPATTTPAAPATSAPAAPAASAATGVDASATASITTGMSVKDNTGAIIGEVTAVKPDATGQNLATIKMGSDVFTVETNKLALQGGSATINASQAELKSMLPKK